MPKIDWNKIQESNNQHLCNAKMEYNWNYILNCNLDCKNCRNVENNLKPCGQFYMII